MRCTASHDDVPRLVQVLSQKHGVDPLLVAAVVKHESGGRVCAARFEPRFFRRLCTKQGIDPEESFREATEELQSMRPLDVAGHRPKNVSRSTELVFRSCSWGLMQVLGETARGMGFAADDLAELNKPEINLDLGIRYLKMMLEKEGGNVRKALLRYNGGGNLKYPDLVLAHYPQRTTENG